MRRGTRQGSDLLFHPMLTTRRMLPATAAKADALLRQALAGAGVTVPARVDLEIGKYVNNRGTKKLMFKPQHEIKDPFAGK